MPVQPDARRGHGAFRLKDSAPPLQEPDALA